MDSIVLAVSSDDDKQWPENIKVIFSILSINVLHLRVLATYSCNRNCSLSRDLS
jgi:hypothetical protein